MDFFLLSDFGGWFWSIYLCRRKIVDLQFKAADGGLAKNDGFVATFHLKQTRTETVCLVHLFEATI